MPIDTTLAVILHCDVVSSTTLVKKDARLAHQRIQSMFSNLSDVVHSHGGITQELRGDALLAKFDKASDAATAALEFQAANSETIQCVEEDIKVVARIGIALGEVVIADGTVTGAGVVLAQRLEQLANPGGIVIQSAVREALPEQLPLNCEFLGEHDLKGFEQPVRAYTLTDLKTNNPGSQKKPDVGPSDQGPILYCSSSDGTSIAYTEIRNGYPMIAVGSWMTHLEQDWSNPLWAHYLRQLGKHYNLIRYDQRGNGMSDWQTPTLTFENMVEDLSAVINSLDHEKVVLFGPSQAASVSLAYAHQYPDRVSHLILYGAYTRGRCKRGRIEDQKESEALVTFLRQHWGSDNPLARQLMTSMLMPEATQAESAWFNEFQKTCATGENIARLRELYDDIDVSALLPEIHTPTLVIHCTHDAVAPISEGKLIASRLPGARLLTLNSNSHLVFEHEPEFEIFMSAVKEFLPPSTA